MHFTASAKHHQSPGGGTRTERKLRPRTKSPQLTTHISHIQTNHVFSIVRPHVSTHFSTLRLPSASTWRLLLLKCPRQCPATFKDVNGSRLVEAPSVLCIDEREAVSLPTAANKRTRSGSASNTADERLVAKCMAAPATSESAGFARTTQRHSPKLRAGTPVASPKLEELPCASAIVSNLPIHKPTRQVKRQVHIVQISSTTWSSLRCSRT